MCSSDLPQWWLPHPDPVRGTPAAGILDRCTQTRTCPKIVEHFGSAEVWALKLTPEWIGTDAKQDLPLPANVRRYYIASTAHGGGAGGYFARTIAVTGEDGETLSWTLGAYGFGKKIYQGDGTTGGDVTVTSTTLANWTGTMTALGGEGGQAGSAGGAGGTASGGTTNTTGGNGTHFDGGDTADSAPGGSAGVAGVRGSGGGPGTFDFENSTQYQGGNGGPGWIEFIWT